MLRARRLVVSGRVQGVGFRFFTQEIAALEGLSGWVRNLPDGRVETLVEGDLEAVDRFERQIARGPGAARVDAVAAHDEMPAGVVTGFRILG